MEREATTLDISKIAGYLQSHLGQKITAYLAGLDNAKTVGLWISGSVAPRDLPKTRLRYREDLPVPRINSAWREAKVLAQGTLKILKGDMVDIDDPKLRQQFALLHADLLARYEMDQLDIAQIRSKDRRRASLGKATCHIH